MTPGPGLQRTKLPLGFLASGVNCGVRRYRPDFGLLLSDRPMVAVGVFTLNQCQAAPVVYSKSILPSDQVRALITNSGQANAATGTEGVRRNLQLVEAVAGKLNVKADQVVVASTGVIGEQLHLDKLLPSVGDLVSRVQETAESFAVSILTTDLVPKSVSTEVSLSTGTVRITGICKGSGMIHPNMATMLGYLLTDAVVSVSQAETLLKKATDLSFNMISVDGDSSTNDCCFLLANGASGHNLEKHEDLEKFQAALSDVAIFLAQSIAADGEGATKLIEVTVGGADDLKMARRAARGVTLSPLIKAAIHGEDPNWGRILARLGAEQVPAASLQKMNLSIQGVSIFAGGEPIAFDRPMVRSLLRQSKVQIEVDLQSGAHSATAWGCDLSKKYVEINTEYS